MPLQVLRFPFWNLPPPSPGENHPRSDAPGQSGAAKAGEKEAEEGVGIGVEANLGVWGIGSVGLTWVGARETLFVNADVHRLDGAERGIDQEGDGHGIEKCGCLLAPLVVKESESVGDRSSLAKEERALELVHLQLSRVDGHDEEGDTGSEEFLSGGDVVEDVPFWLRGRGRPVAEVVVATLDGTTHHNDALEFAA